MIKDEDPIKEYKPFRFGLDSVTDEDINSYEEFTSADEYNDLHECSDDLSDKGSKKEEIAHARYAEQQRRKANTSNQNTQYDSQKIVGYIIFIFFIGIPLIEAIFGMIIGIISLFLNNL